MRITREQAVEAYRAHGTAAAAGRALGVHRMTVVRHLRDAGVEVAPRPHGASIDRDAIETCAAHGETVRTAAALLGCTMSTVRKACKLYGVTLKRATVWGQRRSRPVREGALVRMPRMIVDMRDEAMAIALIDLLALGARR
jgi:DNA-binding protein Fis